MRGDGLDELRARAAEERPTYADRRLSNYEYLDEVGQSEREDPYYFAPSMARTILTCPHQELATHSFSHYYSLEPGQTDARSEEHTSELQSLMRISYAVFCLKKKIIQ